MFDLFAFYSNPETLDQLIKAGIDGIIIDWENQGKSNRQSLYNTQINEHSPLDLERVANKNLDTLICRINGPSYWSADEINQAIDLGATELLVPMIKSMDEVEFILKTVNSRVQIGLMLETNESLAIAHQLNELPIHRFFVGLNDLSIQRESRNLFQPFVDGTIDELRPKITKHFGVAGLTHPKAGHPIPCSHLIKQMKTYNATFGFLRRAFYKDLAHYSAKEVLDAIRTEFSHAEAAHGTASQEDKLMFSRELL